MIKTEETSSSSVIATHKAIANSVRSWVIKSGLTQGKIAKLCGIAQPVLSRQLSGNESIPVDRIRQLISIIKPPQKEIEAVEILLHKLPRLSTKLLIQNGYNGGLSIASDNLFSELREIWGELNRSEKLKVLTFMNDLNFKENNQQ